MQGSQSAKRLTSPRLNPGQVAKMRAFYDKWWAELEPTFAETTEIYFGHPDAPRHHHDKPRLDSGSPHPLEPRTYSSPVLAPRGRRNTPKNLLHKGHWAIKVLNSAGTYEISILRWPPEANKPINAVLYRRGTERARCESLPSGPTRVMAIHATKATLRINGNDTRDQACWGQGRYGYFRRQS